MWIATTDVTDVYPDTDVTDGLIGHVQGLAEIEIGEQDEPVSTGLAAAMVQIVHRFALAASDDDNISQETLSSYSYTRTSLSGLGLTRAEKKLLRKAAGINGTWVQPISVASTEGAGLETAGPDTGDSWLEGGL